MEAPPTRAASRRGRRKATAFGLGRPDRGRSLIGLPEIAAPGDVRAGLEKEIGDPSSRLQAIEHDWG